MSELSGAARGDRPADHKVNDRPFSPRPGGASLSVGGLEVGIPIPRPDSFGPRNEVDANPSRHEDLRLSFPTIRAKGVDGLQLGNGNLQVNVRRYQLEAPALDFKKTLARKDVRIALRDYSANPDDAKLYRRADQAVAKSPIMGAGTHDLGLDLEQTKVRYKPVPRAASEAYVFIEECRGVQSATGGIQYNHHLCVATPTINEVRLLRDSPELRHELIAHACGTAADGLLRARIADSLKEACLAVPGIGDTGAKIDFDGTRSVEVEGGDGATIGNGVRQENSFEVIVLVEHLNVGTDGMHDAPRYDPIGVPASAMPSVRPISPAADLLSNRVEPFPERKSAEQHTAEEIVARLARLAHFRSIEQATRAVLGNTEYKGNPPNISKNSDADAGESLQPSTLRAGSTERASELRCKLSMCFSNCSPQGLCFLRELEGGNA